MAQSITKSEAVDEITLTVRYLLRQRNLGNHSFENEELFQPDLKEHIVENFNHVITAREYEELLERILEAREGEGLPIPFNKIQQQVKDYVLLHNIKSPNVITTKIAKGLDIDGNYYNMLADVVQKQYMEVASQKIEEVVARNLSRGITDLKKIMAFAKREGLEIPPATLRKLVTLNIKRTQSGLDEKGGSPQVRRRSRREEAASGTSEEDRKQALRERMLKTVAQRLKQKQARFVQKFCKPVRFVILKTEPVDNGQELKSYRALYQGKEIVINAYSLGGNIQNIIMIVLRSVRGEKRSVGVDINELVELRSRPNGVKLFSRNVQVLNSLLDFNSFHELIWFLIAELTVKSAIPRNVIQYLEKNFIPVLSELDQMLFTYTLQKTARK